MRTSGEGAGQRRRPVQERSQRTYDAILDAGSQLLAERGLESFTTNAVAERAGISITALYRYFPDKYAIMGELYRRSEERRTTMVTPHIPQSSSGEQWFATVRKATIAAARARVADPDYLALRPLLHAVEPLREASQVAADAVIVRLSAGLRRRNPQLSRARADRAATLVGTTLTIALDQATANGRVERAYLDDALRMVELFITDLLAPEPIP
ncbi:MAG: TetR/AcrR family transcriptional regulator [Candidatus Nanopelagicales bacterium]